MSNKISGIKDKDNLHIKDTHLSLPYHYSYSLFLKEQSTAH